MTRRYALVLPDEAEARRMIDRVRAQDRATVSWRERAGRWPWTVVEDDGKTAHGWADSEADAWAQVREVLHRPFRGTRYRGPRSRWSSSGS
jgi:hypothetical protein